MDWDYANVRGGAIGEFTWDATHRKSGLKVAPIRDIIRYKMADGMVTSITLHLSDPAAVEAATISPAVSAGLATEGFMLTEPEVPKEDLKGQCALVTGGSRGIGKYSAIYLAVNCGMKVAIAARSTDAMKEVVAEIEAKGGEAMYVTLDTSQEEQFAPAFAAIEAKFGPVKYCFANAGVANGNAQGQGQGPGGQRRPRTNLRAPYIPTLSLQVYPRFHSKFKAVRAVRSWSGGASFRYPSNALSAAASRSCA